MIEVNTDRLKDVTAAAARALDDARNAGENLNQITTHHDWGCSEREAINERIVQCRMKIKQLQDMMEGFHHVMAEVTEEFVRTENDIASSFESVEGALREILSVPVKDVSTGGDISSRIPAIPKDIGKIINVVEFDKLAAGFEH